MTCESTYSKQRRKDYLNIERTRKLIKTKINKYCKTYLFYIYIGNSFMRYYSD